MKNVFVMGMDPFNQELLETISDSRDGDEKYRFHCLFDYSEIVEPEDGEYPSLDDLRKRAKSRFAEVEGGPDAVMGYWDFPTSGFVPVIAHDAGLPAQPLESVGRCEHKYWSRLEQKAVLPDMVPNFQALNPFADDPVADIRINYPFWLKPIKSHSSFLGYYIKTPDDLRSHLPEIRDNIGIFGRPFNEFLSLLEMPEEVEAVDGYHCIAEEIISSGTQATVEGYCWNGEIQIFGVIDSIRAGRHHSSFSRYQYPSKLPPEVQERMIGAARQVMRQFDYDQGTFNIEFFWNKADNSMKLLEINSRISKSHSPLFLLVDGATNQKVVLDLALGREPEFPHRRGDYSLSGKFMMRVFKDDISDGVIKRVPDKDDMERVKQAFPHTYIHLLAEEGMRLSDLNFQDSYSYEIAVVFVGAHSQKELLDHFDEIEKLLPFEFDED
ncbi:MULTISPECIES: acetyl-CoA carboxylase biotin carboxylase subunit family protein [unclassified Wenzhouxiangella]|uniref:ATP-grasp domain-containing protein n=1 Tax=unclassified Wenzhouxiangella TaxID=2613841 RepID=UPI000E32C8AF|nr:MULTISPECIES: ATP-grasp domain-containing protein [unclassified Wenzhouxiangella]RFF26858.1 ATP-grasp domain-containing protein [Wenzhouxiangella sp. 15181]RFP68488.1 ATP-grasp domain-containing protein [Wenzhouxiangella sp. 15190]